jgi:inosine/xanthosine triphosphate pyrophosphatase family protein
VILFTGKAQGVIVPPNGEGGFGWDACFVPDGHTMPFGAMPVEEKNLISHRARVRAQ